MSTPGEMKEQTTRQNWRTEEEEEEEEEEGSTPSLASRLSKRADLLQHIFMEADWRWIVTAR